MSLRQVQSRVYRVKDKVVVRESISKMKNGDLWQHQNKYEAGTGMIKAIKNLVTEVFKQSGCSALF